MTMSTVTKQVPAMNKITSPKELYSEFIKDMYSAKINEVAALNFFEERATSAELKELLHRHTGETRMQVLRLEDLLQNHTESTVDEHCRTMQAMIGEARELVNRCTEGELRDFAITASLQRINRCEVFVYRLLVDMASGMVSPQELETLSNNLAEDTEFQDTLESLNKPVAG